LIGIKDRFCAVAVVSVSGINHVGITNVEATTRSAATFKRHEVT
jgi:hypothetical protein